MRHLWILALCCLAVPSFAQTTLRVRATKGRIYERVSLSGLVEPLHSVSIPVRWYALVKKMPVQLGQTIQKGQLLAEVEMQYLQSNSAYLKARLDFYESQLSQAIANEKLARDQFQRQKGLATKQIVAQSTIEQFQMKLVEAQLHRSSVESAIREQRRASAQNEKQLRDANYYAPTDGVLTEMLVDPKQVVGSFIVMDGQTLARIDKPREYRIKAMATDTQVAHLTVGQVGSLIFEGVKEALPAKITEIRAAAYGAKEGLPLFEVVAVFEKAGPLINRGLLATIELAGDFSPSAVTVPWNAVHVTPTYSYVTKINEDGTSENMVVSLGVRGRHRVEVTGIKEGDELLAALW